MNSGGESMASQKKRGRVDPAREGRGATIVRFYLISCPYRHRFTRFAFFDSRFSEIPKIFGYDKFASPSGPTSPDDRGGPPYRSRPSSPELLPTSAFYIDLRALGDLTRNWATLRPERSSLPRSSQLERGARKLQLPKGLC